MPRAFVVVAEVAATVSDLERGLVEVDVVCWSDLALFDPIVAFPENRMERVVGEDILDVGHEQFLVLLFVVQPDDEDRLDLGE